MSSDCWLKAAGFEGLYQWKLFFLWFKRENEVVDVAMQADPGVAHPCPLRVMIAGAPAAGKGTQCSKIVEKASSCACCRQCSRNVGLKP